MCELVAGDHELMVFKYRALVDLVNLNFVWQVGFTDAKGCFDKLAQPARPVDVKWSQSALECTAPEESGKSK
ncbi:hypothetical protein GCM10025859_36460 [Alicyclobacillus fastidiosus]|nr:hypothetical protein GCM10025859_36460 [Alicyclobacillus fastidiosus]